MTVSSIGYGDITPTNTIERWTCTFCMIVGASMWAFVVGQCKLEWQARRPK